MLLIANSLISLFCINSIIYANQELKTASDSLLKVCNSVNCFTILFCKLPENKYIIVIIPVIF